MENQNPNQVPIQPNPPTENNKTVLFLVGLIIIFLLGLVAFLVYQNSQLANKVSQPPSSPKTSSPSPLPTELPTATITPTIPSEPTPQPTQAEESQPEIPVGWLTYTNETYGFAISYPPNYQALDDQNNLYGWPNGVVLIYSGGQSYDLPIEAWDTQIEYENKYQAQMNDLTVQKVGNKFITLLNQNRQAEVDQIIATFRASQ